MSNQRQKIFHYIVHTILLERLELADDGYTATDFSEQTLLLSEGGLGLDSVDALDLLVGLERAYGLEPIEIEGDFIEQHFASIAAVIDMVQARLPVAV
ncbi:MULTISPECIES: phosphopantetheine-binding protein [Pseudomonas]|uniref:Acyl carrier protein n=1 Tax=Pseudomonas costantinii TaxID=168469 RepID=A0A1S2V701_9PSED|nr:MULTISPECIES: phosphopantetheine-binding protein [Pseudomonas]MCU1727308.1 phosphopantetheine-binding protein [Pseudomonas sp. 7P_10.2_Bac1]NVZ18755.1 acyl carrier protein [Pseudomonas costantinii]OIN53996.1 hypothetical protein BFL40_07345 [Pseudomonas costantinii]SED17330.1 acyl carrier protein [Pseudomonas costantinii]